MNNLLLNLPRKLVYNYYVHPNFQLKFVDRAEIIYDQNKIILKKKIGLAGTIWSPPPWPKKFT